MKRTRRLISAGIPFVFDGKTIGFSLADFKDKSAGGKDTNIRPRCNYLWHGLPILIETPKGTYRRGIDPDGTPWETYMHHDYGFLPLVEGADGEGLDVYVGPDLEDAPYVFVVNQHDKFKLENEWGKSNKEKDVEKWKCPKCGKPQYDCACPEFFDEHKVMMGFKTKKDAQDAYRKQYDSPLYLGNTVEIPVDDFEKIVRGNSKKYFTDKPFQYVS